MSTAPQSQVMAAGATALRIAHARAVESQREDRLFEDAYAVEFVRTADVPPDFAAKLEQFQATLGEQVALRTRYLDDELLDAAAAGCRQIVLIGAGMDSRAFRLAWPEGTRVFELDYPHVLDAKDETLEHQGAEPRCERVALRVDLAEPWAEALVDAGLDPSQPTGWLAEGILYALTAEQSEVLFERISELSAPGSRLALDHRPDSEVQRRTRAAVDPQLAAVWKGGPTEPIGPLLERHGWKPSVSGLVEVAERYGRPVPAAFDMARNPNAGDCWLVGAQRG